MSGVRHNIKRVLFGLLGVEPEAVVVNYATGPEPLVRQMLAASQRMIPDRRHFLAAIGEPPAIDGVEPIALEPDSVVGLWWQLVRRLWRYRLGMAPLLLTADSHPLRRAAMLYSPLRVLAFNALMESHHLKLATFISSFLFWRGVPLDRIHLRPRWLAWMTGDHTTVPGDVQVVEGRIAREGFRRVLVLTPFSPYPLSHGGAVRLYHLLREMSREFDVYLLYFREGADRADLQPLLEFVTAIGSVSKPRYREPRWATRLPPEVNEYESAPMRQLLAEFCKERSIDLVQVEYTQLARYPGDILVEHDVTFDLYNQLRQHEPSRMAWWNWKRWRDFETEAVNRYRRVVTMSEKDRLLLGVPHALAIPNGVDTARFQPKPEVPGKALLFVGSFRHFPNVTAFRYFVEEIWPLVTAEHPDARLHAVAGPDHTAHWTGPFPADPRIKVEGFVADVRPLYHACNVVVVPTLVSAGTNVKVLEAMAMQRAIVSTVSGAGGIEVEDGKHLLIAADARSFAQNLGRLLASSTLRSRLTEEAHRLVKERYDWSRLGEMQRAMMRELLPDPIIIRRGEAEDIPPVRVIQMECLPTSRWDPEQYLRHEFYIATCERQVAGFIVARRTAPDEREVLNIAVWPDFRNRGIGEKLLRRMVQSFPGDLFLEVRESNSGARRLYERLGFRSVGSRPGYYDDPPETAVIMRVKT